MDLPLAGLLLALVWTLATIGLLAWSWWWPEADAVHYAHTADGWRLALHELRPDPSVAPRPRPVVLCHGILMNRHCWLPHPGVPSVAEELRRRGYWIWIAELRGSGKSHRAGSKWGYGFRDYADHDVDAIVDEVRRLSRTNEVDWVGHSLGGLVAYTYLARQGPGAIHTLVTVGSPAMLGRPHNRLPAPRAAVAFTRVFGSLDLSLLTKPLAPLLTGASLPWVEQFIHLRGMSRRFGLGIMTWGVQRSSSRMLADFHGWQRANGPFLPHVATIEPPFAVPQGGLLALYGRKDYMAPPANVRRITDFFPDAVVEPADEPDGRPFGHLDLIAGPKEVARVAERIDRFLGGEDQRMLVSRSAESEARSFTSKES